MGALDAPIIHAMSRLHPESEDGSLTFARRVQSLRLAWCRPTPTEATQPTYTTPNLEVIDYALSDLPAIYRVLGSRGTSHPIP